MMYFVSVKEQLCFNNCVAVIVTAPVPLWWLQMDLEHTLGESAAVGAAGVVLWGELQFAKSEVSVSALPYVSLRLLSSVHLFVLQFIRVYSPSKLSLDC